MIGLAAVHRQLQAAFSLLGNGDGEGVFPAGAVQGALQSVAFHGQGAAPGILDQVLA